MWDLKMKNSEPLFRAYSMANHPAEGNIIMLNVRIATPPWDRKTNSFMNVNRCVFKHFSLNLRQSYGKWSLWRISHKRHQKRNDVYWWWCGGPMRSHIFDQFDTKTDRKATFWYGGRSLRELFYLDDFKELKV